MNGVVEAPCQARPRQPWRVPIRQTAGRPAGLAEVTFVDMHHAPADWQRPGIGAQLLAQYGYGDSARVSAEFHPTTTSAAGYTIALCGRLVIWARPPAGDPTLLRLPDLIHIEDRGAIRVFVSGRNAGGMCRFLMGA